MLRFLRIDKSPRTQAQKQELVITPTDSPDSPGVSMSKLEDGTSEDSPEMVAKISDHDNEDDEDEIKPCLHQVTVIDPLDIPPSYGAIPRAPKEKKEKKEKESKKNNPQKLVSDALKTDMAAERTFFKWMWTGLHTGAIGSFIAVAIDSNDENNKFRIYVIAFSWFVALLLVLYGTFAYYRRRHALRTGDLSQVPRFTREHTPLVVLFALVLVVVVAFSCSFFASRAGKV